MSSQTPRYKSNRRLVASNIRGKPIDKMTLYTKEGGNGPIDTIYGREIALRPSTSQPNFRTSPVERLAKTHKIREITSDMIVETDPIVKKEKLKHYKPFFEFPRDRIELKPHYRSMGTSLYQRDYIKPTPVPQFMIKNDFFTTKHGGRTMDFTTTTRNDYKPWIAIPTKPELSSTRVTTFQIPFASTSAYKSSYVDWGNLALNTDRPLNTATTIPELKIRTKTTYREDFKGIADEDKQLNDLARSTMMNVNKLPRGSPIATKMDLGHKTIYRDNFTKYSNTKPEKPAVRDEYFPKPSHPGQYKTIFSSGFTNPEDRLYL